MKTKTHRLIQALLFLGLLAGDQLAKYWAVENLKGQAPFVVLKNVFEFVYIENTGAAFDSFKGMGSLLPILSSLLMVVVAFFFFRIPSQSKWRPLQYLLVLLLAGGLGNTIDRLARGFVVDFIFFVPINFPKFNLADCYLVVSIFILFFLAIFKYNEDELLEAFRLKPGGKKA